MGIDRSTFLIGTDLKIIGLWRNVKVKDHVDEVINKIKELK
jgi:peroxiredoxin Q/BCP